MLQWTINPGLMLTVFQTTRPWTSLLEELSTRYGQSIRAKLSSQPVNLLGVWLLIKSLEFDWHDWVSAYMSSVYW